MNNTPLVSVILNVYNGEDYVADAIRSVLEQTYTNLELIVADDASSDNTLAIIRSFGDPRLHCLTRTTRRHICYTINEALEQAKGDWIAHIDHDDIWEKDKLEKQMAYVQNHPEVGACFSQVNLIDENNQIINDQYPAIYQLYNLSFSSQKEWVRRFFYEGNCISYPTSLIRKDLMTKQNLFSRQLHDFDLWCQMISKTNFYVYPEALLRQRWVIAPTKSSLNSSANEIRVVTETMLVISRRLLDSLTDEQFIDFFREDFRNPDSATPLELKIEKAFLLMKSPLFPGDANPIAFQLFEELLQEEGAVELLEEKYGFTLFDLYDLTGTEVFYSTRTAISYQKISSDLDAMTCMVNDLYSSRSWRITKPMRDLSERLSKLGRATPIRLLRKTAHHLKTNGLRATLAHIRYHLHSIKQERKWRSSTVGYTQAEYEARQNTVFPKDIKFSILVPLYNTPEPFLREMIASVQEQTYANWELCLADGSDAAHTDVGQICQELAARDSRIRYRKLEQNLGISGNTNACIDLSSGDYIALFDHDDLLHPFALDEVMHAICERGADFIYTDECVFESPDRRKVTTIHCKPDYSLDALRANNYICHFSVFSRSLLEQAGPFRSRYDGSQDHDIILRLTSCAKQVVHIPKILYLWRSHPQSVASDISAKTYTITAGQNAVHDSVWQDGYRSTVTSTRAFPAIYQINFELKRAGKVSILISGKDNAENLKRCITSIREKTTYPNYEIIVADNASADPALKQSYAQLESMPNLRVVHAGAPMSYPALSNLAAAQATGAYLLLLNSNLEVSNGDWLERMVMYAQQPKVGAVGAMIYTIRGSIYHAGLAIGLGPDHLVGRYFYDYPKNSVGYMGRTCYAQDLSAVSSDCLMVRRELWEEFNGLDPAFSATLSDVDFCLRLRQAGYLNVWTPFAELYSYHPRKEKPDATKSELAENIAAFRTRWAEQLALGDPYYNPNFESDTLDFRIRDHALDKVFPAKE